MRFMSLVLLMFILRTGFNPAPTEHLVGEGFIPSLPQ